MESIETLPWAEQVGLDDAAYRSQVEYLLARSRFYRRKLGAAGFGDAGRIGGLERLHELPFTEKQEIRDSVSADDPMGTHVAADRADIVRIFSTSGTTGTPSYIPLTAADLDNWVTGSARSYAASGIAKGEAIVSTYNAGPFVAGAALASFDRLGLCHIPVGTGNTERLMTAIRLIRPTAAVMTPSYAAYIVEWAAERGFDLKNSSVKRVMVAGEPGGGEDAMRQRLEEAWGARFTEAMGLGDIGVSLWGECEQQAGMHLGARGFVHAELIDPATGAPVPMEDDAEGELVMTHLKHRGAPMLRFRTRDHVRVWTSRCKCGRTAPRVRCIGRTDDMLIVRGVNVFPTAIREIVAAFEPAVSGMMQVVPGASGAKQEPPLPVEVELAKGVAAEDGLGPRIEKRIRETLVVQAKVTLVPFGTQPRSEYKSKLVRR